MNSTLKMEVYGKQYELLTVIDQYVNNNNIAIQLVTANGEPFATMTTNICNLPEHFATIDINNLPQAISLIERYKLGEPTGDFITSGFVTYPIYKLNINNIKKYAYGSKNA